MMSFPQLNMSLRDILGILCPSCNLNMVEMYLQRKVCKARLPLQEILPHKGIVGVSCFLQVTTSMQGTADMLTLAQDIDPQGMTPELKARDMR
jgi:hypothetical protein